MIVQKFGGSSLADIAGLRRAAELILAAREKGHKVVAVVSAMGDTTDELTDLAHKISPRPSPRELDALLSTGEVQSAALLAMMLQSIDIPARSFSGPQAGIHCTAAYSDADISCICTQALEEVLEQGLVAVVAGFQGLAPDGSVATLGRGGSDTSAVSLAAALGADRCEI